MRKIYVAPSASRKNGYPNRYIPLLKKELEPYFEVLEADGRPCLMQGLRLIANSFRADVFLLSFVETIAFHKMAFPQFLMAHLALWIMKARGRKVVFIFHNPRPHKGENWMSRSLTRRQLVQSVAVISHSSQTADLARDMLSGWGEDPSKVVYACHPVAGAVAPEADNLYDPVRDVLVWGKVLPYKGVAEFVSSPIIREEGLNVLIVGNCDDPDLSARIRKAVEEPCPTKFTFENRAADFRELQELVSSSAFVVFPYLPGSVSGSGALMDTLAMGGTPVGPSVGAFLDLSREGVCKVYGSYAELAGILRCGERIPAERLESFVRANSWPAYAKLIALLA